MSDVQQEVASSEFSEDVGMAKKMCPHFKKKFFFLLLSDRITLNIQLTKRKFFIRKFISRNNWNVMCNVFMDAIYIIFFVSSSMPRKFNPVTHLRKKSHFPQRNHVKNEILLSENRLTHFFFFYNTG